MADRFDIQVHHTTADEAREQAELMVRAVTRSLPPCDLNSAEAVKALTLLVTDFVYARGLGFEEQVERHRRMRRLEDDLRAATERALKAEAANERAERWEYGFRNIAGMLVGNRATFEISEIVERVRVLASEPRPGSESSATSKEDHHG